MPVKYTKDGLSLCALPPLNEQEELNKVREVLSIRTEASEIAASPHPHAKAQASDYILESCTLQATTAAWSRRNSTVCRPMLHVELTCNYCKNDQKQI